MKILNIEWGDTATPYWQSVFYMLLGLQDREEFGSPRWMELSEAKSLAIELAYNCAQRRMWRGAELP